jgi:hypothetical protein
VIKRLRPARSAQSLKARRKSRGRDSDSGTFDPVVVRAGGGGVSAGQTLVGEVLGPPGPVSVDLVRIERTPSGQRLHLCQQATVVCAWSATDANPARATFELEVPDDAVSSARGAQCSLSYALRACLQGRAGATLGRGRGHRARASTRRAALSALRSLPCRRPGAQLPHRAE